MPLAASAAKKESLGDVQAAAADSSAWQSQLRREGRVHQTLSTLWLPRLPNEGRPPDSVRTEPRFWLSAIRRKRLSRRRARPSGPATRQGSQIQSGLLVHSPQLLQRSWGLPSSSFYAKTIRSTVQRTWRPTGRPANHIEANLF